MTDGTEQFVRYREHVAATDELKTKLQALEIQYARLSASLLHLPEKVDQLTAAVNALTQRVPIADQQQRQPDLLRLIDALQERGGKNGMSVERWLLLIAFGGAGWMAARFFIGG